MDPPESGIKLTPWDVLFDQFDRSMILSSSLFQIKKNCWVICQDNQ